MNNRTSECHQMVETLSYGDAISGEVLALQRCLQRLGYSSEIYAINVHPKLKGAARDYRELSTDFSGSVVFHFSLGSSLTDLYKAQTKARRMMIFHNLTDPAWFRGINPRVTADLEEGWRQLPLLCQVTDHLIADSHFNAGELGRLGFQAEVLPLTIDPAKWDLPRNEGIYNMIKSDPGVHVLHVGRLAANKCVEDVIKTFYFLHHKINRQSKLWLAGIDIDTELYSFSLKRLVEELDLNEAVNFVGCLADSELKSLYQTCTAYLCMSEHEGFGLPLVEAMHFGLPVIAYASSAVPETLGEGGVLIRQKNHPAIAELIDKISHNSDLRNKLVAAGRRRVAQLSFVEFEKNVRSIFGEASTETRAQA